MNRPIIPETVSCETSRTASGASVALHGKWFDSSIAGIRSSEVTSIAFMRDAAYTGSRAVFWDCPAQATAYLEGTALTYVTPNGHICLHDADDFCFGNRTQTANQSLLSAVKDLYGFQFASVDALWNDVLFEKNGAAILQLYKALSDRYLGFTGVKTINNISRLDVHALTGLTDMFNGCDQLTSLDLSEWDTANATSMRRMFRRCLRLESIQFGPAFSTNRVTDMHGMFRDCAALTAVDVSGFNTANVTDFSEMFATDYGSSLRSIQFGSLFTTENAVDLHGVFSDCSVITDLTYVKKWRTPHARDMHGLFDGCASIRQLNLNKWDTTKVTDMSYMFRSCAKLADLKMNGWHTDASKVMRNMFNGANALRDVYVSEKWTNLDALPTVCPITFKERRNTDAEDRDTTTPVGATLLQKSMNRTKKYTHVSKILHINVPAAR